MIDTGTDGSGNKIYKRGVNLMATIKSEGTPGNQNNKNFSIQKYAYRLRFPTGLCPLMQEFMFKKGVLEIPHGRRWEAGILSKQTQNSGCGPKTLRGHYF